MAALYLVSTWMLVYLMLFIMAPVLSGIRDNVDFVSGVIQSSVAMMILFTIGGTVAALGIGTMEFSSPGSWFPLPVHDRRNLMYVMRLAIFIPSFGVMAAVIVLSLLAILILCACLDTLDIGCM